jgi:hypothetical protein
MLTVPAPRAAPGPDRAGRAGRDQDIPAADVPPQPKKKRRPRNTVFDDHGDRSAG